MTSPPRVNNFDLLRLLAASQVMFIHGWEHLGLEKDAPAALRSVARAVGHFPGVPIFFVLSGFLIPWAWSRDPQASSYGRNRFLRLYPGMWCALLVSCLMLATHGFITLASLRSPSMIAWFGAQITFAQFYTAPALRGYGLGNPNGSLWTITVEIQFYLVVPVLLWLAGSERRRRNLVLGAAFVVSVIANRWIASLDQSRIATKLLACTVAPYLFYFLLGTLFWVNWSALHKWIVGRGAWWLAAFVAYSLVVSGWLGLYTPSYWPNSMFGVAGTIFLAITTLALGFSVPDLSERLLKKMDLSYGIYLYHGVVLNALVHHRTAPWLALGLLLLVSTALGYASWTIVERPALSRKKRAVSVVAT